MQKPFTCSFEVSEIDDSGVWTPVRRMDNVILTTGYSLLAEMVSGVRNINYMYLEFTNAASAPSEFLVDRTRPRSYYDSLVSPSGYCRVPVSSKEYYTAGSGYSENAVVFSAVVEGGSRTGADLVDSAATASPLNYCSWFHTVSLASVPDKTSTSKDILYNAATFRSNNVFSPIPKVRGTRVGITASLRFFEYLDDPLQVLAGDTLHISAVSPATEIPIEFQGVEYSTATLVINGVSVVIRNENSRLNFDVGGPRNHIFTVAGETLAMVFGGVSVLVSWQGPGCTRFALTVPGSAPSSSSSAPGPSSSSSTTSTSFCCTDWEIGWDCSTHTYTEAYLTHDSVNPQCMTSNVGHDWVYSYTQNPDFCYYRKTVCVASSCVFDLSCDTGAKPTAPSVAPVGCAATSCLPSSSSARPSSSSARPSSSSSRPSSSSARPSSTSSTSVGSTSSSSSHSSSSSSSSVDPGPFPVVFYITPGIRTGGGALYQMVAGGAYAEYPTIQPPTGMSLERWMPGYIEPIYGPSTYQAYYTNNRIYKTWDRPVFSRIQWSCIDLDAAGNVFVGTRVGLNYYAEVWKQAAGVGPIIYVGSILTSSTGVTSVTIRTDGSVYAATEYSGIWKWTAASGVFTYVAGTELPPRDGGTVAYWTLLIADTSGNIWGLVKSIVNFTQVTWLLYKQTAGTGPFNYSGPWDQVSPIGGRRMPTPGTGFAYTANGDLYYTSDGWWEGSILGITSGGSSNLVETCPRYWQQGIARGNCMHLVTTQDILVTDLSTTLGGCPMLP